VATGPRGAIVLADGEVPSRRQLDEAWPGWADGLDLIVAADGGARHAAALGLAIDDWVGDGDSVDPAQLAAIEASGTRIHRVPTDKDATDTELAIELALASGARRLAILGALGGSRVDHALANLALLDSSLLTVVDAVIYDPHGARITVLAAPGDGTAPAERALAGHAGDLVSLLPIRATAHGVTTTNLRYPLAVEDLELGRTRGVSNVRTAPVAQIRLESGRLLVIETPATVGR
jgi:thiamine pyrophosphokinase